MKNVVYIITGMLCGCERERRVMEVHGCMFGVVLRRGAASIRFHGVALLSYLDSGIGVETGCWCICESEENADSAGTYTFIHIYPSLMYTWASLQSYTCCRKEGVSRTMFHGPVTGGYHQASSVNGSRRELFRQV